MEFSIYHKLSNSVLKIGAQGGQVELVSKELNHFGVIADFTLFEDFSL